MPNGNLKNLFNSNISVTFNLINQQKTTAYTQHAKTANTNDTLLQKYLLDGNINDLLSTEYLFQGKFGRVEDIYTYAFIYYNLSAVPKGVGGLGLFSCAHIILASLLVLTATAYHIALTTYTHHTVEKQHHSVTRQKLSQRASSHKMYY